jgi:hypothetical protein
LQVEIFNSVRWPNMKMEPRVLKSFSLAVVMLRIGPMDMREFKAVVQVEVAAVVMAAF